jgi:hypothetical protein
LRARSSFLVAVFARETHSFAFFRYHAAVCIGASPDFDCLNKTVTGSLFHGPCRWSTARVRHWQKAIMSKDKAAGSRIALLHFSINLVTAGGVGFLTLFLPASGRT